MGVAFTLFGIEVKWYGIIIACAVLVAVLVAVYNCKKKGLKTDDPFEWLLWCFPLAIIGARIYYIAFSGRSFTFAEAIAIWNGGMAIYGGVIGGFLGIVLYSVIRKKPLLPTLDIIAPSLILAQSIGRWGNFANQEVYGTVVTNPDWQFFPFAVYIDKLGEWHYATFFYESMLNLIGFVLLMLILHKSKTAGLTTAVYLIFYGTVRFFLEGLRQSSEILFIPGTKIMVSQVVSLCLVVVGLVMIGVIFYKHRKMKQKEVVEEKNESKIEEKTE